MTPHRSRATMIGLWFGLAGAPAAWFAQLLLGYSLWAARCYPADRPLPGQTSAFNHGALLAFDVLAMIVAALAFLTAFALWRPVRAQTTTGTVLVHITESRTRFLALWGMLSAVCFGIAIVFATILSSGVPACG